MPEWMIEFAVVAVWSGFISDWLIQDIESNKLKSKTSRNQTTANFRDKLREVQLNE